jgi:hypothetical protein
MKVCAMGMDLGSRGAGEKVYRKPGRRRRDPSAASGRRQEEIVRIERTGPRVRIWALIVVGVLGLAAILVIPGPQFEPYRRPPDRTLRVVDTLTGATVEGPPPGLGGAPRPSSASEPTVRVITLPRLLNYDETLAYIGQSYLVYRGQEGAQGTVELEMRLDETGEYSGMQRLSGTGMAAQMAEISARDFRYSPALDEDSVPVPIWWPITITFPPPISLELNGMYRAPGHPYREIPPGGFTIEDLLDEKPTFTPLTELPEILNPEEVARASESATPASNDSWAEWPVLFLLDTLGVVRRVDLSGSGTSPEWTTYREVASVYRFSPARKDGQPVPVWVRVFIRIPGPPKG